MVGRHRSGRVPPGTRSAGTGVGHTAAMTAANGPGVLVLGRDDCEDTTRSRDLLTRLGVPFTYLHVDLDPDADAWIRRLNDGGWRTPTILIGDPEQPDVVLREPSDEELTAVLRPA